MGEQLYKITDLVDLATTIEPADYSDGIAYLAIRVLPRPATVGDILKPSHRWEGGEHTEDELSGTCAIELRHLGHLRPDDSWAGYWGVGVALIGSNYMERGEDDGEVILRDPVVLKVFGK
jgi:hypothetical protein